MTELGNHYEGKDSVLIIVVCSNNKRQGGAPFDKRSPSIPGLLVENAPPIYEHRQNILELLKKHEVMRNGISLPDMQLNSHLLPGPDFGGNKAPLYMAADQRYTGRFYAEVLKEGPEALRKSNHHVLIMSGLYGLLLPDELIQAYSCHVEDHPKISQEWTNGSFLTSLLLDYVRRFSIKKVFDLTGVDAYRRLLEWERISKKASVLHVFSEQYAGPSSLPSLGEFARTRILEASEQEISEMEPGKTIHLEEHGSLFLYNDPYPPAGFPVEPKSSPTPEENANIEQHHDMDFRELEPKMFLKEPRDILITSGEHNTVFNKRISKMSDLPVDARRLFEKVSLCPHVLEVYFGEFFAHGPQKNQYEIVLSVPQEGSGHIFGKLFGPVEIARYEKIDIRTTKNQENIAFKMIEHLLTREERGK